MKQFLYLFAFICLLYSCKPKDKPKDPTTKAQLFDSLNMALDSIYQQGAIQGYGVAIVGKEGPEFQKGFGYANKAQDKRYTTKTTQNIASVSKTLIGISLLKAQEMALLKLEDPINQYLPFEVKNPNFPDSPITIWHLATHTSTIVDTDFYDGKSYILQSAEDTVLLKEEGVPDNFNVPESAVSMAKFLENVLSSNGAWYQKEGFLEKKPGELFEYTNVGATLAAYVLEIATKQKYSDFTKQHILTPLQMSTSGWFFDDINLASHSQLYQPNGRLLPQYRLVTYPDGGLLTSIDDMSKYVSELIKGYAGEGTLISKEGYQTIFKQQLSAENFSERDSTRETNDEFNAGIFMGFTPFGWVGHTGGDPGVATFMFFNPKTQTGKLLFVNSDLDEAGIKQFILTWRKLNEYEAKLNALDK